MEILYWFLFFSVMIILSYFTWFQLLTFFVGGVIFSGAMLNYEDYQANENLFLRGLTYVVDLVKALIFIGFYLWNLLKTTYIGHKLNVFLIYLENNYQQLKMELRRKVIQNALHSGGPSLLGTPRLSNDDEDTDDD